MEEFWFYAKGGHAVGPVAAAQLKAMAIAGQIQPADMVIRAGETTWVAASTVPWLFAAANRSPQGQARQARNTARARCGDHQGLEAAAGQDPAQRHPQETAAAQAAPQVDGPEEQPLRGDRSARPANAAGS